MPKLILFAPCISIIVDQLDNTTSLIHLLEAITVEVPDEQKDKIPADASVPVSWNLLALWQRENRDEEKEFEARFALSFASGQQLNLNVSMPIAFEEGKPNFRNILKITGLPLPPLLNHDVCEVNASYRERGVEAEWELVGRFPILLRRPTKNK